MAREGQGPHHRGLCSPQGYLMDLILGGVEHYALTYTFNTISPAGSSLGVKGRHKD